MHVTTPLLVAVCCAAARADFSFPSFPSMQGLNMAGVAILRQDALEISPGNYLFSTSGAAWYAVKQPVAQGFVTEFTFRLTTPGGFPDPFGGMGGEGIAFVIQNAGATALGANGYSMGYGDISNSLAVEFDTYGEPGLVADPNGNHVSIQSRGVAGNSPFHQYSLGQNADIPELVDGQVVTARIAYTPGVMRVYVNGSLAVTANVNLDTLLSLDQRQAWVGFTSATGGPTYQYHDVLTWFYSTCYANCDASTAEPILNVNDFACFLNRFAAGDPYANCDGSTVPPVLNVADFACFLNAFAAGCG